MLFKCPDSEYRDGLVLVYSDVAVAEHERLAHELAQLSERDVVAD